MIRLVRKPSLWANFFGRLLFAIVWGGAFFTVSWFLWTHHPADVPWFVYGLVGLFDLFALGMVYDLVVRFGRTVTNKQPVLEIDHDALQYGSTAQVSYTEPSPESLAEVDIRLVAVHRVRTTERSTTYIRDETCHDQELLRMNMTGSDPVSRMLQIKIPADPPADDAKWSIVVNTRLRQGGLMPHTYPLNVRDPRPSA